MSELKKLWRSWPWTRSAWSALLSTEQLADEATVASVLDDRWEGHAWWRDVLEKCQARWERLDSYLGRPRLRQPSGDGLERQAFGYVTEIGTPRENVQRLGVVGTRQISIDDAARWQRWLERLLEELDPSVSVVSGGAFGVDFLAQEAALNVGRRVEVRFAGGVFHAGPKPHITSFKRVADSGGLLSWLSPPPLPPRAGNFLERNTWLVHSVDALVVVRAPWRSGAMHTARQALKLGVPVLAVPGDPDNPIAQGPNQLLKAGASPLTAASDVIEALKPSLFSIHESPPASNFADTLSAGVAKAAQGRSKRAEQRQTKEALFAALISRAERQGVEDKAVGLLRLIAADRTDESALMRESGMAASALASTLLELELGGYLRRAPGGQLSLAEPKPGRLR